MFGDEVGGKRDVFPLSGGLISPGCNRRVATAIM